ncbi:hypothetical protein HELRODRAFT_175583 [Helobdella robusta]|uniref:Uncharacterized protein n=1 Tax=Helobdella robusta TaxID=6412 RepID=T1F9E5_HELRO|nr:hypothetical protein HELRODRAFT_175583 [Helobdella robusta]ESO00611.1 hypothetical protein HELRODRAFT_175583 [Helobdella robusta]
MIIVFILVLIDITILSAWHLFDPISVVSENIKEHVIPTTQDHQGPKATISRTHYGDIPSTKSQKVTDEDTHTTIHSNNFCYSENMWYYAAAMWGVKAQLNAELLTIYFLLDCYLNFPVTEAVHHATPRYATPHYTTPQHTTRMHGIIIRAYRLYTTPNHATPHHTTTRHTTPHHATPHHATPHDTTPQDAHNIT